MRSVLTILLLMILVCSGCIKPPPEDTTATSTTRPDGTTAAQRPPEYRFPLPADALTLDPAHITDTVSDTVTRRIFSTLVKFAPDGTVVPDLAESWTISEDGLSYEFKLREGVTFHNGDPLAAADVLYSYKRLVTPDIHSERANLLFFVEGARDFFEGNAADVSGITADGDYTVRLQLLAPYAPFLKVLCMSNFGVVCPAVAEADQDGFAGQPVGSGPFVFDSWLRNERITVTANADYFGGRPKLDRIIFMVFDDEKTRFENFKSGALEHCDIPPSQIEEVRNDPALSKLIKGEPAMDMYCYGFNCEQPPFKDNAALRKAINHAVDKENIIETIWGGLVTEQKTYVPEGMFYFWEDAPGYPYDPELAKELLVQAGYPDGEGLPELVLHLDTPLTNRLAAQAVQEDLRRIGVNVKLEVIDWGTFLPKVYAGESLFFQNTWLGDYPDPDTWLYQLLHSDNFGSAGNITRWANSEFDSLVGMAQVELDETRRADLYHKAEQIAWDEAPWLLLFWKNSATLVQPYVRDLTITKMDRTPQLNNAPLEKVYFED